MVTSTRVGLQGRLEDIVEQLHEEGWTDGHPVVPPTVERVERFLAAAGRNPTEIIAVLPLSDAVLTMEKLAINAVMAGCRPEYTPVLVAGIQALCEEQMWLHGVIETSHSVSHLFLINGPIRDALQITSGYEGAYANWRANASICRAIRLALFNVGRVAGVSHMHSFGWLIEYAYCIAENEEHSPWEPYHVGRGFAPTDSTIAVFAAEPPHHIEPFSTESTQTWLQAVAETICAPAIRSSYGTCQPVLALGIDHAAGLARAGFSKADVKRFLFEHARIPRERYDAEVRRRWSAEWLKFYNHAPYIMVPMVRSPEEIHIFVIGGAGPNSLFIPGLNQVRHAIRKIEWSPESVH